MAKVVNINHIGVVVQSNDQSLKFWRDILGIQLDRFEHVPSMNINLAWMPVNQGFIELLEPTTTEGNEYQDFLSSHGPGVHHVCVEVDDIEAMADKLRENHIKIKDDAVLSLPGRKLAFLDPTSCDGVVVELYELEKKVQEPLVQPVVKRKRKKQLQIA